MEQYKTLKRSIEEYIPYNEQEKSDKDIILNMMEKFSDMLVRDNKILHFTASSWLVNESRTKTLMVYHNIYKSWSWTGGHADGEADLLSVAIREAKEETGIKNVIPIKNEIYSLEIMPVAAHMKRGKHVSSHLHVNLTYLLKASEEDELIVKQDENSGVKWIEINKAVEASKEEWMKVIYKKLIEKMQVEGL